MKHLVKINGKDVDWVDAPKGHYLTDVKEHVLWTDERTGATLTLRKIPVGGIHETPHTHPHANQWIFALSGAAQYPDDTQVAAAEDTYIFLAALKGERHGGGPHGTQFTKDLIALMFFDGPQTKVSDEPEPPPRRPRIRPQMELRGGEP